MRLRSATSTPKSYDPETRSFEFVLASERPCRTWRVTEDWEFVEVDEILPMSALVDLNDFVGASILTDHRYWAPPVGVIESARVEGDKLVCRGRLSKRQEVAELAQEVADGIRRSFSVGFEILEDGYPDELAAVPKSAATSLRNFINNRVRARMDERGANDHLIRP